MTKPKREKYSHLYSLSNQGDITKWVVLKQGNIYIEVEKADGEADREAKCSWHRIVPFVPSFVANQKAFSIKAWRTVDARYLFLGLFFASREDAVEYLHLYGEHQAKVVQPKEDKVVKIKHLMEQAYKSLEEAKRLQESFDDL